MKTLLLLRHAKSSWGDSALDDHDRPLNKRGARASAAMGRYLASEDLLPDLVLCSSARRTVETLEGLAAQWPRDVARRIEDDLYLASATGLLERARRLEPDFERVMIVAHNPGIGELAALLSASGTTADLERMRSKYPTAALAEIRFETDAWRELDFGGGDLRRFVLPRELD